MTTASEIALLATHEQQVALGCQCDHHEALQVTTATQSIVIAMLLKVVGLPY
jgi:hypothetical protein